MSQILEPYCINHLAESENCKISTSDEKKQLNGFVTKTYGVSVKLMIGILFFNTFVVSSGIAEMIRLQNWF